MQNRVRSSFRAKAIMSGIRSDAVLIKFVLGMVLSVCLSACQNENQAQQSKTEAATSTPAIAPPESEAAVEENGSEAREDQDVGSKLQEYVGCYNKIDESAHRTITRYASWVEDREAGPTGQEMNIYGLYSLNAQDIKSCKESFEKVANQAPAMAELDSAALAYGNAIVALEQAVDPVYTYYDREDYKDDGFAKGKQLHKPLVDSFNQFEQASTRFSDALNTENDKRQEAELARIEKADGRKMPYLHAAMMLQAKQLIKFIEAETFAAEIAAQKLTAYETIADEAIQFDKQNPESRFDGWSSVATAVEDFRKAAKERVRRIRDKTPYSEGEKMMLKPGSAWMVEGSQEKVINAYNSLIDASNQLR